MILIELAPSMFQDKTAFNDAVSFHEERAKRNPDVCVVIYSDEEYRLKQERQQKENAAA